MSFDNPNDIFIVQVRTSSIARSSAFKIVSLRKFTQLMKFPKNILILDFEGKTEPIQIGAVLLDKETLNEIDTFSSYIFADLKGEVNLKSGISQETLNSAPTQAEIGRTIFEKFGTDILIGSWAATLDISHFKKIINAADLQWELYDYHVLDIWPAAYIYLLKNGYQGRMTSEEMFLAFGARPRGFHDALEDCKIAADVLRKIVQ